MLPYADMMRHRAELLHPHRFSLHDHVNVLRFLVTRTRIAPGDSVAAVDLAFAYNRWAEALAIPTLRYADIVGALDAILTHAPANVRPRLTHGAASHVLDLALRLSDPPRVPTIVPEPLPRDYVARTHLAAQALPSFGAGPVTDDMITFKFVDMFTLQDLRGSISQSEVEHCYRLWALLVGLPQSRATTVWVRVTHYATAFLHAMPFHGLPVRGIRLI